jgi:hypothetical protein
MTAENLLSPETQEIMRAISARRMTFSDLLSEY